MKPQSICHDRILTVFVRFLFCLVLILTSSLCFAESAPREFRVGFFQHGSYWTSDLVFSALKQELKKAGWDKRVIFVNDAHFSPGWDVSEGELEARSEELMVRNDLDLIVVMGTKATRALLVNNNRRTPILALDITDPVKAGLVASVNDSGVDNFTTIIQNNLWTDMFHLFHQTVNFNRLGIVMTNNLDGQIFSHLDAAKKVARDRGFDLVIYNELEEGAGREECQHAVDVLIDKGIDAFVLPITSGFDLNNVAGILEHLHAAKVATFASEGTPLVKAGALVGVSNQNIEDAGSLSAKMMIKILKGATPRDLPMLLWSPPSISLNLETAEKLGVIFSFSMLSVADEIIINL